MKCAICGKRIQETFLKKIIGTFIRNSKGKKNVVCNECQSKLTIEEIKEKLG
ncbi:MAG: hypothetical protein ACQESF_04675 [Nanobdellota archaeon]